MYWNLGLYQQEMFDISYFQNMEVCRLYNKVSFHQTHQNKVKSSFLYWKFEHLNLKCWHTYVHNQVVGGVNGLFIRSHRIHNRHQPARYIRHTIVRNEHNTTIYLLKGLLHCTKLLSQCLSKYPWISYLIHLSLSSIFEILFICSYICLYML